MSNHDAGAILKNGSDYAIICDWRTGTLFVFHRRRTKRKQHRDGSVSRLTIFGLYRTIFGRTYRSTRKVLCIYIAAPLKINVA